MPLTPLFPGVFIEELPDGVRSIAGVATSITAFIGRAVTGPVDHPLSINSFSDFERAFGGPRADCPLGYAVQQFFQNGGAHAIVVRLYKPEAGKAMYASIAVAGIDPARPMLLTATSPGATANALRVRVDTHVSAEVAAQFGLARDELFNLTVCDVDNGTLETLRNLTLRDSPRRIDRVLAAESSLLGIADIGTAGFPKPHGDPDPGNDIWNDDRASTGVIAPAFDSAPLDEAAFIGDAAQQTGLHALQKADLFNLLCIPPDTRDGDVPPGVYQAALTLCVARRAMLIVDAPAAWKDVADISAANAQKLTGLGLGGIAARNAALFFPRIRAEDPLLDAQIETFVACGAVAGVIARTDRQRGVWKAPAGAEAAINGIVGLATSLTDSENGVLNPLGINCLRTFPGAGPVIWGARTLRGADALADDYTYIPVRRLALFIEESLDRGTRWAVFEPNDEPLWAQLRLAVGAFMNDLFRQGALQGATPSAAYFVKCDSTTTSLDDIGRGVVNIMVGFAALKPAEFVILRIGQAAVRSDGREG